MAIGLWILCICNDLPVHFGYGDHVYDNKLRMCSWDRTASWGSTLWLVFGAEGPTIPIILTCYISIFVHVRKSRQAVQNHGSGKGEGQVITAQEVKLVKTLFTIWLVFVICWGPWLMILLLDFKDQWPEWIYILAAQMSHFNSSINSLIYAASNKDFCEGYKRVLCCMCFKKPKYAAK